MRKSEVSLRGYAKADGEVLAGAVFPSGRTVVYSEGQLLFYDEEELVPLTARALPNSYLPSPRTGVGYRNEDVSGVSGSGVVFDFVHFPEGWVIQEWRNEQNDGLSAETARDSVIDFRPSMSMAIEIHGHGGRTEYVYDNGEVANP